MHAVQELVVPPQRVFDLASPGEWSETVFEIGTISAPEVVDVPMAVRHSIERVASGFSGETWMTEPDLERVRRRLFDILAPAYVEDLSMRYGVDDRVAVSAAELGKMTDRSKGSVHLDLSHARQSVTHIAPYLAAGTFNFMQDERSSRPQTALGLLQHMGVSPPAGASREDLIQLARQQLAGARYVSERTRALIGMRYGLIPDEDAYSPQDIARLYNMRSVQAIYQVIDRGLKTIALVRQSSDPSTFSRLAEPLVDAPFMLRNDCLPARAAYLGGIALTIKQEATYRVRAHDISSKLAFLLRRRVDQVVIRNEALTAGWDDGEVNMADYATEMGFLTKDSIADYLRLIAKYPLLKAEQEVNLARRIEAGVFAQERLNQLTAVSGTDSSALRRDLSRLIRDGKHAQDVFMKANLKLVVWAAKAYQGRGVPFHDLIQEGNLGLVRAIDRFDYMKGFKFSSFATDYIRKYVWSALYAQGRNVRVPTNMQKDFAKLNTILPRLIEKFGRDPTDAEISESLGGRTSEWMQDMRRWRDDALHLDHLMTEDGDKSFIDSVSSPYADNEEYAHSTQERRNALDSIISALDERQSRVIRLRFGLDDGEPRSHQKIATILGINRATVIQDEHAALTMLRRPEYQGIFEVLWG